MATKQPFQSCREVTVLDFETTGLSPQYHRVIEVGAVVVRDGKIVDEFCELMNPGKPISSFITYFTGITNEMLKGKPRPEQVMPRLKRFLGNRPIVAHNASFDQRFLQAEMQRAGKRIEQPVLCTMLLSRRLISELSNYKLETLAGFLQLQTERAHRALEDAKVTAQVWNHLVDRVREQTQLSDPGADFFAKLRATQKHKVSEFLQSHRPV